MNDTERLIQRVEILERHVGELKKEQEDHLHRFRLIAQMLEAAATGAEGNMRGILKDLANEIHRVNMPWIKEENSGAVHG
jgi:hypothetical protein